MAEKKNAPKIRAGKVRKRQTAAEAEAEKAETAADKQHRAELEANKAQALKFGGMKVRSVGESFRRAGWQFTKEPSYVPKDSLNQADYDAILNETQLVVLEIDAPEPKGAEADQVRQATKATAGEPTRPLGVDRGESATPQQLLDVESGKQPRQHPSTNFGAAPIPAAGAEGEDFRPERRVGAELEGDAKASDKKSRGGR